MINITQFNSPDARLSPIKLGYFLFLSTEARTAASRTTTIIPKSLKTLTIYWSPGGKETDLSYA